MYRDLSLRSFELRTNLSRLFINFDVEVEVNTDNRTAARYYIGLVPYTIWHPFGPSVVLLLVRGYDDVSEYLRTLKYSRDCDAQYDRAEAHRHHYNRLVQRAQQRLRDRLLFADAHTRKFDPTAVGQWAKQHYYACRRSLPDSFKTTAELVRKIVRAERATDYAAIREGKNELLGKYVAGNVMDLISNVMAKKWGNLLDAVRTAGDRLTHGYWERPVWHSYLPDNYPQHFAHAAKETPGNIAFYPDAIKMEADKLTSMKAGRYLAQFYGGVLSENEIKEWANKQQSSTTPAVLKFISNTDPDGWVWVYENTYPSCMRYNRSNRYLNVGACGERHPVRAYAHPDNALALAYIMCIGKAEDRTHFSTRDEYVIAARTIVNTDANTYLRIYAPDERSATALKTALEAEGYTQSDSTLYEQVLQRMEIDDGILCPYLDGNYGNVEATSTGLVVGEKGIGGQNSSGILSGEEEDEDENEDRRYCSTCGEYYDADEGGYVESSGEWVCDNCLRDYYVKAIGFRGSRELYHHDDRDLIYSEYDSTYYVFEFLDDNNRGMDDYGAIYPLDQLVETSWGMRHVDDTVRLTYEYNDYEYAVRTDAYKLPNGEWCHVNDVDTIAAHETDDEAA